MTEQQNLVPVKQAATYLGVSTTTVYTLMRNGELPFVKVGAARVPQAALDEYVKRHTFKNPKTKEVK
jgi:excisionase family DNA binding protein